MSATRRQVNRRESERTNTFAGAREWEFVRFINPGDLRVAAKHWRFCCHDSGIEECRAQHDDARGRSCGVRALQQRQLSAEGRALRGKLSESGARRP